MSLSRGDLTAIVAGQLAIDPMGPANPENIAHHAANLVTLALDAAEAEEGRRRGKIAIYASAEAWELLEETLQLDAQSAAVTPDLRADIRAALDSLEVRKL
jgi:hypothetical protein